MSANLSRAQLLYQQSRYGLAERELRRNLAEDPDNAIAHALLSLCLNEQDQHTGALESARTAIHLDDFAAEGGRMCYHALCGMYGSVMQVRGGIVESVHVQCLDPGPPYAPDGGTIIFKLSRGKPIVH